MEKNKPDYSKTQKALKKLLDSYMKKKGVDLDKMTDEERAEYEAAFLDNCLKFNIH